MGVSATATTRTERKVTLKPAIRTKLQKKLSTIANLQDQIKALTHAKKKAYDEVEILFDDAGEGAALDQGTEFDGFKLKVVRGVSKKLNEKVLMQLGVTRAMLDEATETTLRRPYLLITAPGEQEDE